MSVRIVVIERTSSTGYTGAKTICVSVDKGKLLVLAVSGTRSLSLPAWLGAARVQVVIIQRRIEQQEKLALRLMAPHRVRRKHHDVSTTNRHIDNRRTVGQLIGTRKHAADQQVLLIVHKTQHDARSQLRRREERAFALVSIGIRPVVRIRRPWLRHCLNHVRIINTAASRSARGASAATLTTATAAAWSAAGRDLK